MDRSLRTSGVLGNFVDLYASPSLVKGAMDLIECTSFPFFLEIYGAWPPDPTIRAADQIVVEWWWDSINTFLIPWGMITMTPLDFNVVNDLSFLGAPVPEISY